MIKNATTTQLISEDEIICKTIFSQMRGLILRKKQNLLMIFLQERKINLHMFFVFFPIDVLIVDEKMKIVDIKRNLMPFTVWSSTEKGKYVLELGFPSSYSKGDILQFKNELI